MPLSCIKKRGITSKHHGGFLFSELCSFLFATEINRESHKTVCKNKDFCNSVVPSKDNKILEINQYQKYFQ